MLARNNCKLSPSY